MSRPLLIGLLVAVVTGCSDSAESLRAELDAARAESKELRAALDALKQEIRATKGEMDRKCESAATTVAAVREDFAKLRDAWSAFEASYSPEVRQALAENVNAAEKATQLTGRAAATSEEEIAALKKILAEAETLKNECARHAKEARGLNDIGAIQGAARELQSSMSSVKDEIARIQHDTADAQARARRAESTANNAESKASRAESTAQRALFKTR